MKLAESGWKDQVRKDCLDLIKKRSKSQMPSPPVEQLLEEVSQQAIGAQHSHFILIQPLFSFSENV